MSKQPSTLELAKNGNSKAIAVLINRQLQPQGIKAKVSLSHKILQVILEANEIPDKESLTPFIYKGLKKLGVNDIERLAIHGKAFEQESFSWSGHYSMTQENLEINALNLEEDNDSYQRLDFNDSPGANSSDEPRKNYSSVKSYSKNSKQTIVRSYHTKNTKEHFVFVSQDDLILLKKWLFSKHWSTRKIFYLIASLIVLRIAFLISLNILTGFFVVTFWLVGTIFIGTRLAEDPETENLRIKEICRIQEETRSDMNINNHRNVSRISNDSDGNRAYSKLIDTLKSLQWLCYVIIGLAGLIGTVATLEQFSAFGLIFWAVPTITGWLITYIVTESLVAVIDLLSRIEKNTRAET